MRMIITPRTWELIYEIVGYLAMLLLIGIGVAGTLLFQWITVLLAGWGWM